jgi:nucleoside-diphosphate-sugar epimerase
MPGRYRISSAELAENRHHRTGLILLTGGTGFLGSHIAAHLLREGYRLVLLARPDKQLGARERMDRLWDWFGLASALRERARVIESRIDRPDLGLDPGAHSNLLESVDGIVHCASDTSFLKRKRAEIESVNIEGARHILDFAAQGRCTVFHLVSTAYVAGRTSSPCREELARPAGFTNIYEETKCRAEWLATQACREAGIQLSIYRPSIVYGDSKTGRSLIFNALYYPVRTAVFLRRLFEADIRERGGRRALEMGVHLDGDGWMFMPIRMAVGEGGGISLVPVDYFVRAFAAIWEEALEGGIFHIVNPRLKKIRDIIGYATRLFRIRGIEAVERFDSDRHPRNALEALFDCYLEAYNPYIQDMRIFDTKNAGPILERKGLRCPKLDYDVFSRCMTYAVDVDWGAKLFS